MTGWWRSVWAALDWRRAAVVEARHRGAAAMLDESMRRSYTALLHLDATGLAVDCTWDGEQWLQNGVVKIRDLPGGGVGVRPLRPEAATGADQNRWVLDVLRRARSASTNTEIHAILDTEIARLEAALPFQVAAETLYRLGDSDGTRLGGERGG